MSFRSYHLGWHAHTLKKLSMQIQSCLPQVGNLLADVCQVGSGKPPKFAQSTSLLKETRASPHSCPQASAGPAGIICSLSYLPRIHPHYTLLSDLLSHTRLSIFTPSSGSRDSSSSSQPGRGRKQTCPLGLDHPSREKALNPDLQDAADLHSTKRMFLATSDSEQH
jgi:hypothetical protein